MKNTVIISDDGLHSVIIDSDGSRDFVFYKFGALAADWSCETVAAEISDGSPESEARPQQVR